jgi:hypothetical protein
MDIFAQSLTQEHQKYSFQKCEMLREFFTPPTVSSVLFASLMNYSIFSLAKSHSATHYSTHCHQCFVCYLNELFYFFYSAKSHSVVCPSTTPHTATSVLFATFMNYSIFLSEKPFSSVLLPEHYSTHCHQCFVCFFNELFYFIFFSEEPFSSVLLPKHYSTHCHQCYMHFANELFFFFFSEVPFSSVLLPEHYSTHCQQCYMHFANELFYFLKRRAIQQRAATRALLHPLSAVFCLLC